MAGLVSARAWQTVRPHIPLIKFRKGGVPRDEHRSTGSSGPTGSSASPPKPSPKNVKAAQLPILEDYQLPLRYRRPLLDEKEIEAINRGGAV